MRDGVAAAIVECPYLCSEKVDTECWQSGAAFCDDGWEICDNEAVLLLRGAGRVEASVVVGERFGRLGDVVDSKEGEVRFVLAEELVFLRGNCVAEVLRL